MSLLCLLGGAAAGCAARDEGPLVHPERMGLWVQTLAPEQVDEGLAFCREHALNLHVNLMRDAWDDERLASLCARAEAADVALRLWPALPHEEGYWANQENAGPFVAYFDELLARIPALCPRAEGLVIDMETPFDRMAEMESMRAAGRSNLDIVNWLLEGVDEARFLEARALYADAVDRAHAQGLRVSVSTLPQNLDDYDDGDESIARAMWTPIEGIDWDQVAFQVYRNLFTTGYPPEEGSAYTPGLIASYARSARAAYGPRAALDLGLTGRGPRPEDGLGDAAELQADIAAALAEGLAPGDLAIFSLDGLRRVEDDAAWVQLPAPRPAAPSAADAAVRDLFRFIDALEY